MTNASKFALLALMGIAAPSWAGEPRCAGTEIVAAEWRDTDRERICAATRSALDFLRQAGLRFTGRLVIRPLARAPDNRDGHLLGQFEARSREIRLLPYEAAQTAARQHPRAFGVPMSQALWQSYVAHEVAHAVAEPLFAPGVRHRTATEYLAAVVQLSTLPAAERQQILALHGDVPAFGEAQEISGMYYLMSPAGFAVKAYRHYMGLGDGGPAFIGRLLREGLPN